MARKRLLWFAWFVTLGFALLCSVIVVQGVLRDRRVGEPVLPLDVSRASDWRSVHFRIWGEGTYRLFLAAVNWDSSHVGVPLGAELDVEVLAPTGTSVFERQYAPGTTGLVLPINYRDAQLAELPLSGSPFRRWTLKARVIAPDERFRTATTTLKLYKQRYDPGMGGMMNYVMIFPGGLFMVFAFSTALRLTKHGARVPLAIMLLLGAATLVLLVV